MPDGAEAAWVFAKSLMIFVEHDARSRGARAFGEILERPYGDDVECPATDAQHVVSQQVCVGHGDDTPAPVRKADSHGKPLRAVGQGNGREYDRISMLA